MGFLAGHVTAQGAASPDRLAAAAELRRRLAHRGARGAAWVVLPCGRGAAFLLASATREGERCTVAFDGRLTNRRALDDRLRAAGQEVRGASDAEAVAAGWGAWGPALLPHLDGAFAIAVHDAATGTVFLARDRFGQRPLHYAVTREAEVVFASEVQAMLAWPGLCRTADLDVLAHLLAFGHGPVDRMPLQGMRRLRPGHLLAIRPDGGQETTCWWRLPDAAGAQPSRAAPPAQALRERLVAAVEAAQDGATTALVGGAAGAALAACLDRLPPDGPASPRRVPSVADCREARPDPDLLARLLWHRGEPLAPDGVGVAVHAELRGEAPGLVLVPDGAGELLLSHRRYRRFARDLARLRESGCGVAGGRAGGFRDTPAMARDLYHAVSGGLTEAERLELSGPGLIHTLLYCMSDALGPSLEAAGEADAMSLAARLDLALRLPARELPALDAAVAAAGAGEFACPFLDADLVALLVALPEASRRWLLPTGAAAGEAPAGFGHPLAPGMREFALDTLLGASCRERGLFSRGRVEALVRRHLEDPSRDPRVLWALLGVEMWCQAFLDGSLQAVGLRDAPSVGGYRMEQPVLGGVAA